MSDLAEKFLNEVDPNPEASEKELNQLHKEFEKGYPMRDAQDRYLKGFIQRTNTLVSDKDKQYSSSTDLLATLKEMASISKQSIPECIKVLMAKHWVALWKQTNELMDPGNLDLLEERCMDLIRYLQLLCVWATFEAD